MKKQIELTGHLEEKRRRRNVYIRHCLNFIYNLYVTAIRNIETLCLYHINYPGGLLEACTYTNHAHSLHNSIGMTNRVSSFLSVQLTIVSFVDFSTNTLHI